MEIDKLVELVLLKNIPSQYEKYLKAEIPS